MSSRFREVACARTVPRRRQAKKLLVESALVVAPAVRLSIVAARVIGLSLGGEVLQHRHLCGDAVAVGLENAEAQERGERFLQPLVDSGRILFVATSWGIVHAAHEQINYLEGNQRRYAHSRARWQTPVAPAR